MGVKVDAQGRLVLPRAARERLGIRGRAAEIAIEDTPDGLFLEVTSHPAIVTTGEDGLPAVSLGGATGSVTNDEVLAAIAAERARR